ncbi:hypothetical protein [Agromyces sp. H66]|uniref:hypothetical protein n=1 Tax=Agromyces sp. H66 TaxID=2529859 RepID=UPI0010AA206A|nr:hypothetical protein [Agromyces sp. H66]
MIIDSGWDFVQLTSARMNWSDPRSRRLFVVGMDRDLGYYFTRVVTERFNGDLSTSAEQIVDLVDEDYIRYFATIEQVAELDTHDWWADDDGNSITSELERVSESRGIHHIGHYQLDPTSWHSTGPMHSFRDYYQPDLPKFEITRPPQYDGWRRATKPEDRFGFRNEFGVADDPTVG